MIRYEPAVLALATALRARGWKIATAESCTGGLIAAACTAVAGSSDWFERGFVTYSNDAKTELLGVPATLIDAFGAVSAEVACAMAEGALVHSHAHSHSNSNSHAHAHAHAQLAVAVTGIAGPGGGAPAKPVGTVWVALAQAGGAAHAELLQLAGDRAAVREQTVHAALARLLARARAT